MFALYCGDNVVESHGAAMNAAAVKRIPGPESLLQIVGGIRRRGFLAYVGERWQTYGDVFRLQIGYIQAKAHENWLGIEQQRQQAISSCHRCSFHSFNTLEQAHQCCV
jgi:hypothetical protein